MLLFTTPITIRLLGTAHYGLWALLTAMLAPLGLASLSVGQATVKFVAEEIGAGHPERAGPYVQTSALYALVVGLLGWLVLVLVSGPLVKDVFNVAEADKALAIESLTWVGAAWAVGQLTGVYSAITIAMQRYMLLSVVNSVTSLLVALAGITALLLGGNLTTFIQSLLVVQLATLAFWVVTTVRSLSDVPVFPRWHPAAFRRTLSFGIWQSISQIVGSVAQQSDRYVMGIVLTTSAVGAYNLVQSVVVRAYGLFWKSAEVLFPAFSHIQGEGDRSREGRALLRATWTVCVMGVMVMGPLLVWGSDFMRLWIGPEIAAEVAGVLRLLAVGAMVGVGGNVPNFYLMGTNRTRWTAALSIGAGATLVAGSVILVPVFGLEGAGYGALASSVVHMIMVSVACWRILGRQVSLAQFASAAYAPSVVGIISALTMLRLRLQADVEVGWVEMAAWIVVTDIVLGLLLLGSSLLLPNRTLVLHDVRLGWSLVVSMVGRFADIANRMLARRLG